jgi:hypothetical protein
MTENTISTVPALGTDYRSFGRSVWQIRSAPGEAVWTWIAWAFAAYWILFTAGAFLDRKQLNTVGGVVVLGILAWLILERLWVRLDAVVFASLTAAVVIPLLQILSLSAPISPDALVKHVSLCLVMAASRLLCLPVASTSKLRWPLAVQILLILLISLTIHPGTSWDGGTRHSGLFEIPNNLALIPFLLLFLIDLSRDGLVLRVAVHAIVVVVLAFTGTSGAMVAYAIGLAVHLHALVSRPWRILAYTLVVVGGLAAVIFLAAGDKLLPETRLTKQLSVVSSQFQTMADGGDVAYYQQEKVLGPGSSSAIWRMAHWRRTIAMYLDGTPAQQILGFGLGSSPRLLGKLPHNEYLRLLFEQGIVGLLLFLFAWQRIIMTAPAGVRYIGLIVAIYSFSENNLDNFPFMALFILFLSARGLGDAIKTRFKQPLIATWNAGIERSRLSSG